MNKEVVIDACLVIKRVVPEPMSDLARELLRHWKETETSLIAPVFFMGEVDSILRQKVIARKELTPEQAQLCWEQLIQIPVTLVDVVDLRPRIWEISIALRQAHVYDAVYLALAEARQCEFWTSDERLYNAVRNQFPFVRSLKNFRP